jgi:hypothetical protein
MHPNEHDRIASLYPPVPAPLSAQEKAALIQLMGEVLISQWRDRSQTDHDQEHQVGAASGLGSLLDRALRS